MPEMHLRKPGFSYGVREPFTKNKKKIKKTFKKRRFKIHLSKQIRESLLSTWYRLVRF